MTPEYLDISRSVFISSPAGSGKTEKLARRYVSLLQAGFGVEKILAVTFTEKAAAEMKERILAILGREDPAMLEAVRGKMPLMRISTIHSFCLKLLKRFAVELDLDPSLAVLDGFNASLVWEESIYEALHDEGGTGGHFSAMITERGIKGWDAVLRLLNELHSQRPESERLLSEGASRQRSDEEKLLGLYEECLRRYRSKKRERRAIDFSDIELLAYEALLKNPQWQNILYTFDGRTDHILIDEFQDTSSLQWKIIEKLTEEWRAGLGAKRESGKTPTVFLVGDQKQSIYLFRGANAAIFQEARRQFSEWMGDNFHFEEITENYRSLPALIEFTNNLFERLMPPSLCEDWRTRYVPFSPVRKGEGRTEMILLESNGKTRKRRVHEADVLAMRICSLHGSYKVHEGDGERPCSYGDMAVLLRRRTHLPVYEEALRRHKVPFIVLKGIGFYGEPEVAMLRELLFFLVDPEDDYPLFALLRSPLFGISHRVLYMLKKEDTPLIESLKNSRDGKLSKAFGLLSGWLRSSDAVRYSMVIERALAQSGGWRYFYEKQRHANVKKFINVISGFEAMGMSGLEIREQIIAAGAGEEPKANVETEGVDAVRIMTVHAAKGLEFPIVFLPALDETAASRSCPFVIDEERGRLDFSLEEDPSLRKEHRLFQRRRQKEAEEEKRLFYVAVTRAKDCLCMLAAPKSGVQHQGRLACITDNLGHLTPLRVVTPGEVRECCTASRASRLPLRAKTRRRGPVHTGPVPFPPGLQWKDVTEDLDIRSRHGEDWVLLGILFHRLFEELSKGSLRLEALEARTDALLKSEGRRGDDARRLKEVLLTDFGKLRSENLLDDVVLPRENAYAEMPFVLRRAQTFYRGRIDRLIVRDGTVHVYDYKTFPVREKEVGDLLLKYRFQMDIYTEAAERILGLPAKPWIFLTHLPLLVELQACG
jgi:ATP-dependent helicase/nuclease subunit A